MKRQGRGGRHSGDDAGDGGNRFYVERLGEGLEEFAVEGPEAAHAAGSRRLRPGDTLILFDGSGWDVAVEILQVSRRELAVRRLSRTLVGAPTAAPIVCATALPKGSREDVLVSKCAEMGVSRLVPVDFARGVVDVLANWEKRRDRFGRLAIEAAKQSGASTLLEAAEPMDFAAFVKAYGASLEVGETAVRDADDPLRLLGMPRSDMSALDAMREARTPAGVVYLVGPEGGVTDDEAAAATAAGFMPVRLGATTLRIETACVAFAALAATALARRP